MDLKQEMKNDTNLDMKRTYVYVRKHHFRGFLDKLQAKEQLRVCDHDLKSIVAELKQHEMKHEMKTDDDNSDNYGVVWINSEQPDVSPTVIFHVLKKLKLRYLYPHYVKVWVMITGKQPLQLTNEMQQWLLIKWDELEPILKTYQNQHHHVMISYLFLIRKLLQMMNVMNFSQQTNPSNLDQFFLQLNDVMHEKKRKNCEDCWLFIAEKLQLREAKKIFLCELIRINKFKESEVNSSVCRFSSHQLFDVNMVKQELFAFL